MNSVIKLFATVCGVGYLPLAPGTFGTVIGIGLWFFLAYMPLVHYIIFAAVFILFASWVADRAQLLFGAKDPKVIVIDEVAGFFVTMLGHSWGWKTVLAGFILVRIFDIVKPFPGRWIERKLSNGFGVVLDDVAAGIYANVCLMILKRFGF
ncbi:MAG: hypothetical protein A3I09_04195 [Deltaproteobacteria bacterium RIFCSPLOWO2_02_FULL_47_10]|nr:MAG: hypothetical protein A3I09_04195 [Deltaproteobacteria bacterium RIFCSPLOWO2_02_FULL_47_10]